MYYVYKLIDPGTGQMKYIGTTINPKTRLSLHISKARNYGGVKIYAISKRYHKKLLWIKSLLEKNKKPILKIIKEFTDRKEALTEETRLINFYYDRILNFNRKYEISDN